MTTTIRRAALGVALVGGVAAAGLLAPAASAQSLCDPSYPDFCIPPVWEAGDLDCGQIGGSWFTVYQPDPHGFDGDYDGIGCESSW